MTITIMPIVIGTFGTATKGLKKGTGGLGGWRRGGDQPDYIIVDKSHNTEKSPGNSRRLAVTQTPVKDHQ